MSMIDTYIPTSTSSTKPMLDQPIPGRKGTRFFWGVTMFSSLLGGLFALLGILLANGAPQQAAAAAVGCLAAVGPYCLARAVDELRR